MTDRKHRNTGLIVSAVLIAASCWNLFRGRTIRAELLGGIALVLAFVSLFIPAGARAFHRGWMGLAHILGAINTRILMTIAFFGIITPVGLSMRLMGRDRLQLRAAGGNWISRRATRQTTEGFQRSF